MTIIFDKKKKKVAIKDVDPTKLHFYVNLIGSVPTTGSHLINTRRLQTAFRKTGSIITQLTVNASFS